MYVSPLVSERRFAYGSGIGWLLSIRQRPVVNATMDIGPTLYVTKRADFRRWLAGHHRTNKEIWLVQYKKATGKPSLGYEEAVDEAICFGWIDGFVKSMDAERFAIRFTPRRPKSHWTDANTERARNMIAAGRMTAAGRAALPADLVPDRSSASRTGRSKKA